MMEAHDRLYLEEHDFARTIAIDTLGVRTTEFDLSAEKAAALHESGRLAARRFLEASVGMSVASCVSARASSACRAT